MQENISRQLASIASKSNSDRIFILGKGPSLDLVDCAALPPGIIINLNDSERVFAGQIGVFSANWVRHSLQQDGFRCDFYLAGKPLPAAVNHVVLPPIPLEIDDEDMDVFRLGRDEFYDESFVLLTALKAALLIARNRGSAVDVYLLGFDFNTSSGSLAKKIGTDYSGAGVGEREAIVASQEHKFKQFKHYLATGELLRLHHVGNKEFSDLQPHRFMQKVCGHGVSNSQHPIDLHNPDRVLIVAEFTNNHLGDPARLVEMVERSKEAGADLVKVQKRDVDNFYTPEQLGSYYWSPFGKTLGEYRRGVELNSEMLGLLDEVCRKCEIEWFCSVLDYHSYEAIKAFSPRLLKIPSTISNHVDFHRQIAADYHGAIVVSTGYTEESYVNYVLETYSRNELIYLLHCVSAYPTPRAACNVAIVRAYSELRKERDVKGQFPQILPGYSSHDLGSQGCMLAVAAGAQMLEKHVKLGNADWIHFDKVAIDLNSDEFLKFVRDVRLAEEMAGSTRKKVLDCEHHKYTKV
jgi:sialic acid synthase SpsE